MKMKSDVKFEEELTCCFKIDMKNLTHFDPGTQKSLCALMGFFSPKYIMFELKRYRGFVFDGTEE